MGSKSGFHLVLCSLGREIIQPFQVGSVTFLCPWDTNTTIFTHISAPTTTLSLIYA